MSKVRESGTKSKSGCSPPCPVFQIIPWNWKDLTNRKVPVKKVFWHVILHSYMCNALCNFFIKIESNRCFPKTYFEIKSTWPIKSSMEEIVLSRDSKELFEQGFVKCFNQNRKHVEAQSQRTGTLADFTIPLLDCQKQPPEVLYKKTILKNFAISKLNTCVGAYF